MELEKRDEGVSQESIVTSVLQAGSPERAALLSPSNGRTHLRWAPSATADFAVLSVTVRGESAELPCGSWWHHRQNSLAGRVDTPATLYRRWRESRAWYVLTRCKSPSHEIEAHGAICRQGGTLRWRRRTRPWTSLGRRCCTKARRPLVTSSPTWRWASPCCGWYALCFSLPPLKGEPLSTGAGFQDGFLRTVLEARADGGGAGNECAWVVGGYSRLLWRRWAASFGCDTSSLTSASSWSLPRLSTVRSAPSTRC